jgi:hypothetical protein
MVRMPALSGGVCSKAGCHGQHTYNKYEKLLDHFKLLFMIRQRFSSLIAPRVSILGR